MLTRQKLSAVIAVAATMTALSACGSVGSSGNANSGGGGGKSGARTLKIGLSGILSGPAASAGEGTDAGVEAYFHAVNARGGINGYKFTWTAQDNAYDPAKSASVARNLVSGGANFIVTEGTAPVQATAKVANPSHVPIVAELDGGLLKPPGTTYVNTFGVNPVYAQEAAKGAQFILDDLHEKNAALIYLDAEGESQSEPAFKKYYAAHGGHLATDQAIQLTTTDFAPMVQRLKASGAKVVYAFVFDAQLPGIEKAAAAIGYHPKWVGWFDIYSPSYLKLAGSLSKGTYVSLFVPPTTEKSDPTVAAYDAAMRKYEPSQLQNPPAEQGWTIAAIIAHGVQQATAGGKAYSEARFDEALTTLDNSPVGLLKGITYNSSTHSGATKSAFFQMLGPSGTLKQLTPYTSYPSGS